MAKHTGNLFIGFYFAAVACCYAGERYDFKPISFRCPDENSGVFEVVKKSSDGALARVRMTYDGPVVSRTILSVAPPLEKYEIMADSAMLDSADTQKRTLIKNIMPGFQPIKERVCDDPDKGIRARYFEIVERNRKALEGAEHTSSQSNRPPR